MSRKWSLFLAIVLIGGLIWYLFLKPHDYVIRFKTKALPGTIDQTLKAWGNRLDSAKFLGSNGPADLKYRLHFNDSSFIYHWKSEVVNDSVSRVKAYVTDDNNSLAVRTVLPFSETNFEKRTRKTVQDFATELRNHLDNFKVRITGKDEISAKYCACVEIEGTQSQKAVGMMANYSFLSGVMAGKEIALNGRPLVEIKKWNTEKDSIIYDFCFPVLKSDSLPQQQDIFYKQIDKQPALRAVYNGNYITSDRAWYALLDYAEKNDITVDKKPLEVFHSNPSMGGNDLEWETEVFMPIQD